MKIEFVEKIDEIGELYYATNIDGTTLTSSVSYSPIKAREYYHKIVELKKNKLSQRADKIIEVTTL